ncbi:BspA family leucine-rich repeat surface protein [Levilactobacillus lanxiensis]|uniref:BspA family leucine-rich repeat surface protein n=1 Tax=Levilactobacillus lanxiensis TaxID=2799568 RepID=A0ABW4D1J5_9LACO|nr:BspA family leucine-rich repeat surface protein [Levilactobacillus lanxiensis]
MEKKRIVTLFAGLAIGASLGLVGPSGGLFTPPVTVRAEPQVTKNYSGTMGTNCQWRLTSDDTGQHLVIDGGDGGILPDQNSVSGANYNEGVIVQTLSKGLPENFWLQLQLQSIELKGKLKAPQDASFLFSGLGKNGTFTGLTNLDTHETTNMTGMFSSVRVHQLDLSSLDTGNVTNMAEMFQLSGLTRLDLSSLDTGQVTTMNHMFAGTSVKTLDLSHFDTGNVTDMTGMFRSSGLTHLDLSYLNTDNVTLMPDMFNQMTALKELKIGFNTAKVTDMARMFNGDNQLTNLVINKSKFKTSNVGNMSDMFNGDSELRYVDVSGFDTHQVHFMQRMFAGMTNLQSLDLKSFKTKEVQDFSLMFNKDTSLKRLDLANFETDSVLSDPTDKEDGLNGLIGMFEGDSELTSLDISKFKVTLDSKAGKYTYTQDMFKDNDALRRLVLGPQMQFYAENTLSAVGLLGHAEQNPQLSPVPITATSTGKWQAVGAGTESDPLGAKYTSDGLIAAYTGNHRPAGRQVYVWEPVNRPVYPVTPPVQPPLPPVKPAPEPTPGVGSSLTGIRKLGLYRQPTFTSRQRLTWYKRQPRGRQPQLVVIGQRLSRHGRPRYRVRDVNHQSPTYRLTGYVTTQPAYVQPTYYSPRQRARVITVINPRGVNQYRRATLTGKVRHVRQGQQLRVKRLVRHHLTTRFYLTNGQYVTANRQLVQTGRQSYPQHIRAKRAIVLYRDANCQQRKRRVPAGRRLTVRGWDFSDHGTRRYRVAGGFVTANPRFVKRIFN